MLLSSWNARPEPASYSRCQRYLGLILRPIGFALDLFIAVRMNCVREQSHESLREARHILLRLSEHFRNILRRLLCSHGTPWHDFCIGVRDIKKPL